MTLPLTPEMLRGAYDLLSTTPPFSKWNLPPSEEVTFRVVRSPNLRGWYRRENGRHVIAISSRCTGYLVSLLGTMAHEMIHLHEAAAGACTSGMHSAAFNCWAAQVCKYHGFDPKMF